MPATRSSATHGVVVAKSNRVRHCGRFLSGLVPGWRIRLHEDEDHVVVVPLRHSECECALPAADSLGSSGDGNTSGLEEGAQCRCPGNIRQLMCSERFQAVKIREPRSVDPGRAWPGGAHLAPLTCS